MKYYTTYIALWIFIILIFRNTAKFETSITNVLLNIFKHVQDKWMTDYRKHFFLIFFSSFRNLAKLKTAFVWEFSELLQDKTFDFFFLILSVWREFKPLSSCEITRKLSVFCHLVSHSLTKSQNTDRFNWTVGMFLLAVKCSTIFVEVLACNTLFVIGNFLIIFRY